MPNNNGWYGIDLDGTLARYDGWRGPDHIGEPVPLMLRRVKEWLAEGKDVRIFTARVYGCGDQAGQVSTARRAEAIKAKFAIMKWCEKHIGKVLPITCTKDYAMAELWDDRAIQVIPNTGIRVDSIQANAATA